jgi:Fuseless
MLDDQLFPENPEASAITSLGLGTAGMTASQGLVARALAVQRPMIKPVARFGALYTVAMSCVLVWRGTWVGWDCVYERLLNSPTTVLVHPHHKKQDDNHETATTTPTSLSTLSSTTALMATSSSFLEHSPAHATIKSTDPGHLTASGMASHLFAILALGGCGVFASVLAPPAAVSVIKDLAIKVSRPASGTTTSFLKRSNTNEALEFVPHLAGYVKNRRPGTRSFGTNVREFHSSAFQATRYRY